METSKIKIVKIVKFDFSEQETNTLSLHDKDEQEIIIANILYMKAEGNYTRIFLNNNKEKVERILLKYYEEALSEYGFVRIHRETLVNLKYVTTIDIKNDKKCFIGEIPLEFSRERLKLLIKSKILFPFMTKNDRL